MATKVIEVDAPPTPFWKSRTFWVLTIAIVFNALIASGVISVGTDTSSISNGILSVLAILFRWTAVGPLMASSKS